LTGVLSAIKVATASLPVGLGDNLGDSSLSLVGSSRLSSSFCSFSSLFSSSPSSFPYSSFVFSDFASSSSTSSSSSSSGSSSPFGLYLSSFASFSPLEVLSLSYYVGSL